MRRRFLCILTVELSYASRRARHGDCSVQQPYEELARAPAGHFARTSRVGRTRAASTDRARRDASGRSGADCRALAPLPDKIGAMKLPLILAFSLFASRRGLPRAHPSFHLRRHGRRLRHRRRAGGGCDRISGERLARQHAEHQGRRAARAGGAHQQQTQPTKPKEPTTVTITYKRPDLADIASMLPSVDRTGLYRGDVRGTMTTCSPTR